MQRFALIALLAGSAAAAHAQAPMPGQAPTFVDRARVQEVQPQYEMVQVPRQQCTTQLVQDAAPAPQPASGYAGTIIGGIAGGLLGHQVGGGNGKTAATAAGAVIGALTGQHIANSTAEPTAPPPPREVQNCQTVYEQQQRLNGYRVTYDYRGNQYVTVLPQRPGASIPVRVSVTPLEEGQYHPAN
jgi:uncharacterized protein YcfJ